MTKKKTTKEFKREVYSLVGDQYKVVSPYINSKTKLEMLHTVCGQKYKVKPNMFLSGRRCPYCSRKHRGENRRLTNDQFKQKVFNQVGNEYTFLEKYINTRTELKVRHNICGYEYRITPDSFLHNRNRCPYCNKQRHKTKDYFEKYIQQMADDEYSIVSEYYGASYPVTLKHKKCGHIWTIKPSIFMQGVRCPHCNNFVGEQFIQLLLDFNKLSYKHAYGFSDLKDKHKLHYDFYIPSQNILIEYQGVQHYKPIQHFGGKSKFEIQQKHDQLKRDYARKNGYNLIEVPYTIRKREDIKDYLIKKGLELK